MDETTAAAAPIGIQKPITIRVRCDNCDDIDVPTSRLQLIEIDVPGRSWYGFTCPGCEGRHERPASEVVCRILRGMVATSQVTVPQEAREQHLQRALVVDDVLDALLVLRRSETPADLLRAWVLAVEAAACPD